MDKTRKIKLIKVISVILFIILFALYSYISYRAEYLQVLEIGKQYLTVFNTNNEYKIKMILAIFITLFLIITIANRSIKKGLKPFFDDEKKEMPKLPNKSIAFIISVIGSVVITKISLDKTMLFFNSTWFGINDPVFGMDIGFFLFQKTFIELVLTYIISLLVLLLIYTAAYYILVFNLCLEGVDKELLLKSKFIQTLKTYTMLTVITFACTIFIDTYNIVYSEFLALKDSSSTKLIGAGITDITIKLWGYRILAFVTIISVALILRYIFKKEKTKKLLASISIVPAYLVCLFIVMIGFNYIFVNSNKLDTQKQYIGYNIEYTKKAYNIAIQEQEYENSDSITKEEIEANSDIINNIKLVDETTTLKTLNTLQTNSGYYSYGTTRVQKYTIDGQEKLVYISPREIISSTDGSKNNKTYEYTHGFGTIITSASNVDETGNIIYIQKGFDLSDNKVSVVEPRIYFGIQTNSTIIINSENKSEFDYPANSTNSTAYTYNGTAGIKLNLLDKLILAIKKGDINILFSSTTQESKFILNRNIIERAKTILPDLIYDEEPYMIISDEGKQIWVLDAYTVSNEYPYSQKTTINVEGYNKQINYIRNSVKVLIDPYNGTLEFYIMDKTDPIIMAYQNMYPELFKDGDTIPTSITSHFVYSEYLYNVQAEILKIYHNVTEDVLYRGDDIWAYATYSTITKTSAVTKIEPYYTMVKENGENKVGLVIPYTVDGKQNITSYLIGTVDNNGKMNLKLYKYASGSNVLGPTQLDKEIEQDERISKEIESINVTGTKVTKTLIIVPIGDSLLYVEPIYQTQLNEKNAIPLLKKVVVASGNKVAIGDNIKEALENLVSQSAVNIEVESSDTIEDLINAIIKANQDLKDSTATQNFEMIGKDITKLQELIDKLQKQRLLEEERKANIKDETNTFNSQNVKEN